MKSILINGMLFLLISELEFSFYLYGFVFNTIIFVITHVCCY